ncbi:PAS domain S-box protein [Paucibacter sp. Y2R2-4]|uniref:PAS domain-containing sensor histidine kinase n=1 Tax=Paucibacter sp. Y2R2-4 TaxID=2893553 RepID=UPI0021E3F0F8|nr:PAS domain S-box protein [Paucibacter sp. Y2R2-4]MCV2348332.1 PAS domain S-box protein [Paucibacter sp. Y2R2-4]
MPQTYQSFEVEHHLIVTDELGRTRFVNGAFTAHTGYSIEDMCGRSPGQLLQGKDADPKAVEAMAAAVREGKPCHGLELINHRKDGTPYKVMMDIEPMFEAETLRGFISMQTPITASMTGQLHASGRTGIWWHSRSGRKRHWSADMYPIYRRDPALGPLSQNEWMSTFGAKGCARLAEMRVQAASLRRPYSIELEVQRGDGSPGWVLIRGEAEFDSEEPHRIIGHHGSTEDITELVAIRQQAQAANGRLQALFDGALNAILLADDEGHCIDANEAACHMLGYTKTELLRMSPQELMIQGHSQDPHMNLWRRLFASARQSGRTQMWRKDGQALIVEYSAVAHIQPGVHLSVLSDVTTQVRNELALHAAQQQLRDFSLRQQEEFDEFRAELARDVHDQLGQMLGALKLEVDLLMKTDGPADLQHMRTMIQECVNSVRDVSRALRPEALELGLLPALRSMAKEMSMGTDVDIQTHLPEQLPALPMQTARTLYRIVQEALTNASIHADAHAICVRLDCHDDVLDLEVRDDGCGFSLDRRGGNRGLGMLGMQERAKQLGAELAVQSTLGEGTSVRGRFHLNTVGGSA